MAAASPLAVIKGRFRLILTPTNLAAAAPYGGTYLGMAHSMEFEYGVRHYVETAEEWGGVPSRVFYGGSGGVLRCALRGYDPAALAAVFPSFVVGASGAPTIAPDVNASPRPGAAISGVALLAVPAESSSVLPAVLLYNACSAPGEAARYAMSAKVEAETVAAWYAVPDSRGYPYRTGLLEDLVL